MGNGAGIRGRCRPRSSFDSGACYQRDLLPRVSMWMKGPCALFAT